VVLRPVVERERAAGGELAARGEALGDGGHRQEAVPAALEPRDLPAEVVRLDEEPNRVVPGVDVGDPVVPEDDGRPAHGAGS
jgi:hypothetical protein